MRARAAARALAALTVLVLPLASCAQIGLQARPVAMNHRAVELSCGVSYEDLFVGRGPAATRGDELELDYTLWLADDTRVDSTLDRGVPVRMTIGEAPVRGLDDGLVGMQAGGRRKITVPPELGYGSDGVEELIPPDATLVFEVHVVALTRK